MVRFLTLRFRTGLVAALGTTPTSGSSSLRKDEGLKGTFLNRIVSKRSQIPVEIIPPNLFTEKGAHKNAPDFE